MRKAAVDKLKALHLQAIPERDVMEVVGEMTAYVYDWQPDLLDLDQGMDLLAVSLNSSSWAD